MRGRAIACALLLAGAACHGARPAPTPAPVSAPAPVAPAGSDTVAALAPADSSARDTSAVADHEVAREAVQIFGDTAAPPAIDASAPSEPSWDIDVRSYETHARVEYYIDRFQREARDRFTQWLARGGRYDKMIRAKLRAGGLPEDMSYLALIESGYDPNAFSSAAAVGIWQFMSSTARGTGLRVDWWVDERRDPVRSTDAAVKFLHWLDEQFGSLYLAAAAYNGGPGRVARGLSRYADEVEGQSGDDAFFTLAETDAFRAETKDYVPKLIAAALVAKDPTRYGFDVTYEPDYVYDTVRVGPATPLAAVAAATGASVAELIDLNPHILRGIAPPSGSFVVRVPVGTAARFDSAFAALPAESRVAYKKVVTKKGETMTSLARRTDRTAKQLGWYNPHLKPNRKGRLPVGEVVLVPSPAALAAARDLPDPSLERYPSARARTTTHVVRRGESLGLIARKYGTTVHAIMRLNGLKKSVIYPGQEIIVRSRAHARRSRAGGGS